MKVRKLSTMDSYIREFARLTPDHEAAKQRDFSVDYKSLDDKIDRLCHWLSAQGLHKGDRLALLAGPGLIYYTALMAASRLGLIYVGISPRYTPSEIAHCLKTVKPSLVLIEYSDLDADREARFLQAGMQAKHIVVPDYTELPQLLGSAAANPASPEDIAVIVFTSGSTGSPKGAALHHGGLIDAAISQYDRADSWEDGAQARYLSNLPINHVGGIMNLTLAALVSGGALLFQEKFEPQETLELIEREAVTTWLQVPAMFTMAVNHPAFGNTDFSNLRTIGIGGGPVSAPTLERLHKTNADIFVEYGQTEVMSSLSYSKKGADDDTLLATIGKFDPRFETRIASSEGVPVEINETGEIQARGNCVLRSYWNNPHATEQVFTKDGWLKTGDMAQMRPDGNVTLKGRLSEMIKTGGYNVYPREVERALEKHSQIAEVVVYGVPDDLYTERIEAALELKDFSHSPDQEELIDFCRKALAGYKIPRHFHMFENLPRLANGKIDRAAVKNG